MVFFRHGDPDSADTSITLAVEARATNTPDHVSQATGGIDIAHTMLLWKQKNGAMMQSIFIAFASVAIWSSIPLTIRLFTTLKRRRSLYFYSILTCTWGLSIHQIGYLIQGLAPNAPWVLALILSQLGWIWMVTGFSVVLYSRLKIILEHRKLRNAILAMIVFNGVVWHTALIVTNIAVIAIVRDGSSQQKATLKTWKRVQNPLERTQIVMFAFQETTISYFYVRAAYAYLKGQYAQKDKTREAMFLLILVQIIIVLVDVALIALDAAGMLQIKGIILSFAYAVKLELEFVVLNQLVDLSKMGVPGIPSFSAAVHLKEDD